MEKDNAHIDQLRMLRAGLAAMLQQVDDFLKVDEAPDGSSPEHCPEREFCPGCIVCEKE